MFRQWCAQEGFAHSRNLSHVLMDGGCLSVPFDKLRAFNERYIDACQRGERLFVVEQKTTTYNFFCDIDYKDTEALSLEEIEDVARIICDKVRRYGGQRCLVSVAEPKRVDADRYKTGVHLNWSGMVVDQTSAVALREHILVVLYTAKAGVDWNEVIDSSVYGDLERGSKGSGFRLPWSYKKGKCTACQGKGCDACEHEGKITQGMYLPVFAYEDGKLTTVDPSPTVELLEMATVRTSVSTPTTRVEPPAKAIKEGAFTKLQTKDELDDIEARATLEMFIQRNMEGQGSARVTKIFKYKHSYLVSTTSRYCENLAREHGSNHVWFYVSGNTIAQKCFCRCETVRERRDGFCRDFVGKRYMMTSELFKMLYPDGVALCRPSTPSTTQGIVETNEFETFIRRYFTGHEETKVIRVQKNKIFTNNNFCADAGKEHGQMSFSVDKRGFMTLGCPCKVKKSVKVLPSMFKRLNGSGV
jgi:hypothetical protein